MEEYFDFNFKKVFESEDGVEVFEFLDGDDSYILLRDFNYIKDLFPDFNAENKEGLFFITENDKEIYD